MPQTSYQATFNKGFEGMQADTTELHDRVSRINVDTLSLYCGRFVKKDTSDQGVLTLSASTDAVEGILFFESFGEFDKTVTGVPAAYVAKSLVPIMRNGRVWMVAEQTCTPNSPVFVRYANGTSATTTRGTVRIDADGAGAFQLRGAKYVTGATAGGLVVVEFNKMANDAAAIA